MSDLRSAGHIRRKGEGRRHDHAQTRRQAKPPGTAGRLAAGLDTWLKGDALGGNLLDREHDQSQTGKREAATCSTSNSTRQAFQRAERTKARRRRLLRELQGRSPAKRSAFTPTSRATTSVFPRIGQNQAKSVEHGQSPFFERRFSVPGRSSPCCRSMVRWCRGSQFIKRARE